MQKKGKDDTQNGPIPDDHGGESAFEALAREGGNLGRVQQHDGHNRRIVLAHHVQTGRRGRRGRADGVEVWGLGGGRAIRRKDEGKEENSKIEKT